MVCRCLSRSSYCVFIVAVCIKLVLSPAESHLRLIELIYRHGDAPTFIRFLLFFFSLSAPRSPPIKVDRRRLSIAATPHLPCCFVSRSHTSPHRRANRQRGDGSAVPLTDDSPLVVYSPSERASREINGTMDPCTFLCFFFLFKSLECRTL